MTTSTFRISLLALGLAASPAILQADSAHGVEGVWDVRVTVTDCAGNPVRTVRSVQMFSRDGSFTETANTFLRGSSLGTWNHTGDQSYSAVYWFFRYKPDGTFASIAKATDMITLNNDGTQLTSSGTIQDFDANNNPISTGCFTHAASRLSTPPTDRDH